MKKILEFIIAYFFKLSLLFRYRIKVKGLEKLNKQNLKNSGGVIFMPNHPTYYIDPIIATLSVWPKFFIRPMIVEYMYYLPFIHGLMKFMGALPIPNFSSSSNSVKKKKNEKVFQAVVSGLKNGENFLIYPAGKVKFTAFEAIGGSSAIHRILAEAPEANVVLVRIKGLWGSSFSRAVIDKAPELSKVFIESLKIILKNLIFFTPRREVIVELEPAGPDFPKNASRLELNKYLEEWYNRPDGLIKQRTEYPGDSLMLVSYSMWMEKYKPIRDFNVTTNEEISIIGIPQKVKDQVIRKLAELRECDPSMIKPQMHLAADLGLDSLDTADLVAFLHDQFDVKGVAASELTTVHKLMAIASTQIVCRQETEDEVGHSLKWNQAREKHRIEVAAGQTIIESFLTNCATLKSQIACADGRVGIQTYNDMKLRAILLAERLRHFPGKYIGIMLPASVAASLLEFAVQLAGKIPLMVNWTVGPRHLDSVVKLSNVEVVITSWAFIDRLSNVDLNGIEDMLVMIEDLVREISIIDKLRAWYRSKLSTHAIMKIFGADKITKDDPAVLLFTSGTESMPKGVLLSHHNILSNLRAAATALPIYSTDVIFGILPPFHSFGFTVSGLFGFITGVRIFFFPDPTDGSRLAKKFEEWGITIMCGAPTFTKGMLKAATKEQLKTLRLCVSGAEKAPPELFKMLEDCGKAGCLTEGYGITECSPVLTINLPGGPPKGVGVPLPGVELCIVHPETEKPLQTGEQGLILARGPNIFKGYLNPGLSSPFTTINGVTWYKTGDLGFLDKQGVLTISGRMKRFIKIGGEMISLASLEEGLLQIGLAKGWPISQEGPTFAVCAKELPDGKSKIFLFSTFDLPVDEVNSALKEAGFSNLVKVASVTRLKELPVMGTGKVNYRQLQETCVEKAPSETAAMSSV